MPRGLITNKEREQIAGKHGTERKYQAITRVRKRIREELPNEIRVLDEYYPDVLQELREIVNGEVKDCHQVENWLESNGGVIHQGDVPWFVFRIDEDLCLTVLNQGRTTTEIGRIPDDSITDGDVVSIITPDQPRRERHVQVMVLDRDRDGIRLIERGLESPAELLGALLLESSNTNDEIGFQDRELKDLDTDALFTEWLERIEENLDEFNSD